MKVFTNTAIVESRSKWAKRIAPLTMLFLVGGLFTNILSINSPEYFRPTLILLALGFIFAMISSRLVNRWVREPRADQFLSSTLKKFGNDYMLFNYTSPVSHVLLTPNNLYVVVVKNQDGQVFVNGDRVYRKFAWSRLFRFFADDGLGAPVDEVRGGINKLDKLLRQQLPDDEIPATKPLIVFSNQNVELVTNEPIIPVLKSSEFKTFLREREKGKALPAPQRAALAKVLAGSWGPSE